MVLRRAARLCIRLKAELRRQHCKRNRGYKCRIRRSQPALAHALQQVVLPHHAQHKTVRARRSVELTVLNGGARVIR